MNLEETREILEVPLRMFWPRIRTLVLARAMLTNARGLMRYECLVRGKVIGIEVHQLEAAR